MTERATQIAATIANHLHIFLLIEQVRDNKVVVASRDNGQRFIIAVTEVEEETGDCV